jgi:hypothetical protein
MNKNKNHEGFPKQLNFKFTSMNTKVLEKHFLLQLVIRKLEFDKI